MITTYTFQNNGWVGGLSLFSISEMVSLPDPTILTGTINHIQ